MRSGRDEERGTGSPGGEARWRAVAGALLLVGVAMRVNNALRYRTGNGFDAVENIEYVRLLMDSWALPAPDAGWATSHPPLFYYASAALWHALAAVGLERTILQAIPIAVSLAGLVAIAAAVALVRRTAPGDLPRAVVAGGLLLFLPVHVYMAAMVGEELVVTLWMSLALVAAAPTLADGDASGAASGPDLGRAALVGLLGGLALLTKMTGVLVIAAIACAWGARAMRERAWRPAIARCAVMGAVAVAVGGWFYLHNLLVYGYLYPQDLAVHAQMFEMPPGARDALDYLRLPLATFTDPQLLNPDLLRSIWGSTYDTVWYDGHRHFLARSVAVSRMGTTITLLALLPTAAFVAGIVRAARRAWRAPGGLDTLLLGLVGLTLAGYVAFTWGNPWYTTVKGSYLLGLSVPFAVYASESLVRWARPGGVRAVAIYGALAVLLALVVATFTIGPFFVKLDGPGLPWRIPAG